MVRVKKPVKTIGKGAEAKRPGAGKGNARYGSSPFRVRRTAPGQRAGTTPEKVVERAVTLWKDVIANRKLHDLNLHLQGLYAELGKAVFEALSAKIRSGVPRFSGREEIVARIADMRKQTARLAAEERTSAGTGRRKRKP